MRTSFVPGAKVDGESYGDGSYAANPMLRQDGRRACDAWLVENGSLLGKRSSVDIGARYLKPYAASRPGKVRSASQEFEQCLA